MSPSNLEGCIEVEGSPQKGPTVLGPYFLEVGYRNAQYTIENIKNVSNLEGLSACPTMFV